MDINCFDCGHEIDAHYDGWCRVADCECRNSPSEGVFKWADEATRRFVAVLERMEVLYPPHCPHTCRDCRCCPHIEGSCGTCRNPECNCNFVRLDRERLGVQ